MNSEGRQYL